ncbi:hypothetical protein HCN44_008613 [Aphidius gifuensis]|uniref:Ig-like domain-containing protein n=1 Tax=Aphidius gifuensis TaxID=684658 RepID=A0A835CMM1_APHGI|nr:muscle M-line assembly protein unc-89-like [Aphidius gifuensis]XP_044017123.1 muscle M-line assembly protein unc-89-like [Aphidius gifuensis]XP_044017125.1 muscle M-line assembly protein unc-89-like [Aphidius gifuensis]KAF7989939.1 hypothetical protein HCN44_008613 [Aphidius gifuensis]
MDLNDQRILSGCSLLRADRFSTNKLQDASKSYDLTVSTKTAMNHRTERLPIKKCIKTEEIDRLTTNTIGVIKHENMKISTETTPRIQKQKRKTVAPRFVSPVTGMIVDQGNHVVLEGLIDGYPPPKVYWRKNGQELNEGVKTLFEHNHVCLELKNVNVCDAGRYTCIVENQVGEASSTADLIVKKTIFPPVFGKRLQAQIVKKNERAILEVEITGTPEPIVTWYKNDEPVMDIDGQLKQIGNCYLFIIEKADIKHAGKYMVNASNSGGEAQSVADFVVFEPIPDTMTENHKTIVYENIADKNLKIAEKKDQLPSAELTAEHVSTTKIAPSSTLKTILPVGNISSFPSMVCETELDNHVATTVNKHKNVNSSKNASRDEETQSIAYSDQHETKQEQKFHMKLQHQAPILPEPKNGNVPFYSMTETSEANSERIRSEDKSITRQDKLVEMPNTKLPEREQDNYVESTNSFESRNQNTESHSLKEKETDCQIIQEINENYDIKVDKLTKSYERSMEFQDSRKLSSESPPKSHVHGMLTKLEYPNYSEGINNTEIDFPYEKCKLSKLNTHITMLEDTTASGSPIHGTLMISRLVAQSESAEKMLGNFNLVPESNDKISLLRRHHDKPENFAKYKEEPVKNIDGHKLCINSHSKSQFHLSTNSNLFKESLLPKTSSDAFKIDSSSFSEHITGNAQRVHPKIGVKQSNQETREEVIANSDGSVTKADIESSSSIETWSSSSGKNVTKNILPASVIQPEVFNSGVGKNAISHMTDDNKNYSRNKECFYEKKTMRDLNASDSVKNVSSKTFHGLYPIFKGTSATLPKLIDPAVGRFGDNINSKCSHNFHGVACTSKSYSGSNKNGPSINKNCLPPYIDNSQIRTYQYQPSSENIMEARSNKSKMHDFFGIDSQQGDDNIADMNKRSFFDAVFQTTDVMNSCLKSQQSSTKSIIKGPSVALDGKQKCRRNCLQPYFVNLQENAPVFTTPLKNIAVINGQTARFECIVRAHSQPEIVWFREAIRITDADNLEVYYRNGICRLIIPNALPENAGMYTCLASNNHGANSTSASLQVSGERRVLY